MSSRKRVAIVLMIKNESRIIERCITRALSIADAICVCDTGSTDDTVQVVKRVFDGLEIPTSLTTCEWKNFGHNRTRAFLDAQDFTNNVLKWNPKDTYGLLLDADMIFVVTPQFDKQRDLTHAGYMIKQKTPSLEYYNTRFARMDTAWRCVGVTHEYWDSAGTHTEKLDSVYIDDVGDGGCKSDKFERDERLLTQGLIDEPKNERYMFYLAQTLRDLGRKHESIAMYKRRVEAGGWAEECWFAMYQVCSLYGQLDNFVDMEYWGLRGMEYRPERTENVYMLTKTFRANSQHYKAWHYMLKGMAVPSTDDVLFVETQVYKHLFKYEKAILNYYVQPHAKEENLRECVEYFAAHGNSEMFDNIQHYVYALPDTTITPLHFPDEGDFSPSSVSFTKQNDGTYLCNVRYVNYRIKDDGGYTMRQDGVWSDDNIVRTRNYATILTSKFVPVSSQRLMTPNFPQLRPQERVQGLEDLRLYRDSFEGVTRWVASTRDYTSDGKVRQMVGVYDVSRSALSNGKVIMTDVDCEKNWVPLGDNRFVYSWNPFKVGTADIDAGSFVVQHTASVGGHIFEKMRGSSNAVLHNGFMYCITHITLYTKPRKYYHQFIKLSANGTTVVGYTLPFYFKTNAIEYVLAMDIDDSGTIRTVFSQKDASPAVCTVELSSLKWEKPL